MFGMAGLAASGRGRLSQVLEPLGQERLDLVQFHWWDYGVPGWVQAAQALAALQREGLIAQLGGTNFDTPRTQAMLDAGVPLVAMQSQYSLLDRRAEHGFVGALQPRGVQLLCYGTLAGGFFVAPTIFTGVTPAHTIFREEVFGPVLAVSTFETEAEAVALANESEFGLADAVCDAQRPADRVV
jgi:aryl-alcohol dehydrogenase-like predicted oxidoreductase